ncbi:MAG: ABC transporter permease [Candidatus Limiplasma sp.]|nr:ABC transporter permease [Candidatus Limiplasma sp.]
MRMKRFKTTLGKLMRNRLAALGLIILVAMVLIALFTPALAPHDPNFQTYTDILQGPSEKYPMGTDNLGRCVLSRVLYGTRITIVVGVVAVAIAMTLGVALGLLAGYYKGRVDAIISSLTDAVWSFPTIILALAITAALGPGLTNVLIAIGIVFTPAFARVVRSMVLSVREMEYVQGAKAIGLSDFWIITRYILPNVFPVIIVQASLNAAQAIIAEASLSFMGLGIQPPEASWGYMLKSGYPYLWLAPWLSVYPGVMILLIVLSLNFLGDGLRDALDVRLKTE